jgi:hypothetical protein
MNQNLHIMKTTDIYTSDRKESATALGFIAVLFALLLVASNLTAAPVKTDKTESYTAYCNNYQAVIEWNILNDNSTSYYTVERTQDGVNFEFVNNVQAISGTSIHQYSIIDNSPLKGVSYYRISNTDENGKETYLNTIVYSSCENDESLDASDSASSLFIRVNAQTADSCYVIIKDVKGNVILSQSHKVSIGLNNLKITPKVEKGVYILSVTYSKLKLNKIFILNPGTMKS